MSVQNLKYSIRGCLQTLGGGTPYGVILILTEEEKHFFLFITLTFLKTKKNKIFFLENDSCSSSQP